MDKLDLWDAGAIIFLFLVVAGPAVVALANAAGAQDEILPVNAPEILTKSIRILTAEERSTILISDIWQPPELERIKIGQGGRLGAVNSDSPIGPYGWQAFIWQDARGSWRGGYEAVAFGGF